MSYNNVSVARDVVAGIEISTVRSDETIPRYETCLFDDRRGKRYGNDSHVVDGGYRDDAEAISVHMRYVAMTPDALAALIAREYVR